jgi:hypothetical protein
VGGGPAVRDQACARGERHPQGNGLTARRLRSRHDRPVDRT